MRRRVLGAATFVGLAPAACSGDADPADTTESSAATTSAPRTTVPTTTTTEAPLGPDELLVTYDGETCEYSGPDTVTLADQVTMTFRNDSQDDVSAFLKHLPPDRMDELQPFIGADWEYDEESYVRPTLIVRARPGEEGTNSGFLAIDGTYVVDCTLSEDGFHAHTWWPAAVEVTR